MLDQEVWKGHTWASSARPWCCHLSAAVCEISALCSSSTPPAGNGNKKSTTMKGTGAQTHESIWVNHSFKDCNSTLHCNFTVFFFFLAFTATLYSLFLLGVHSYTLRSFLLFGIHSYTLWSFSSSWCSQLHSYGLFFFLAFTATLCGLFLLLGVHSYTLWSFLLFGIYSYTLWSFSSSSCSQLHSMVFFFFTQLHSLSSSGEEWRQRSCGQPHMLLLHLEEGPALQNVLCCIVLLATAAGWWWCQLKLMVHACIPSVLPGTKSHPNNLLLSGQEVVVVLLCFWLYNCPDGAPHLNVADTVDRLV